jgi:hypothetical protein
MPLIPQIISFFNSTALAMQQPLFKCRYQQALKMLESEQRDVMKKDDESMKSGVPVQFAVINVVKKKQEGKGLPIKFAMSFKRKKQLQEEASLSDELLLEDRNSSGSDYILMNNKL